MFWIFGCEACGILMSWPGIEPTSPTLEGGVLTTGPPGKSLLDHFLKGRETLVFLVSKGSKILFVSPYFFLWKKKKKDD